MTTRYNAWMVPGGNSAADICQTWDAQLGRTALFLALSTALLDLPVAGRLLAGWKRRSRIQGNNLDWALACGMLVAIIAYKMKDMESSLRLKQDVKNTFACAEALGNGLLSQRAIETNAVDSFVADFGVLLLMQMSVFQTTRALLSYPVHLAPEERIRWERLTRGFVAILFALNFFGASALRVWGAVTSNQRLYLVGQGLSTVFNFVSALSVFVFLKIFSSASYPRCFRMSSFIMLISLFLLGMWVSEILLRAKSIVIIEIHFARVILWTVFVLGTCVYLEPGSKILTENLTRIMPVQ